MSEIKFEPNYAEACLPVTPIWWVSHTAPHSALRPPPATTTHGSVSSYTWEAGPSRGGRCPGRQVAVWPASPGCPPPPGAALPTVPEAPSWAWRSSNKTDPLPPLLVISALQPTVCRRQGCWWWWRASLVTLEKHLDQGGAVGGAQFGGAASLLHADPHLDPGRQAASVSFQ